MARGGIRRGAGRKKGSGNKRSRAIAEKALEQGISPLEYMLDQMRKPYPPEADALTKLSLDGLRFEAAKAAAPYVHPRLNAIEHSGKEDAPLLHEVSMVIVDPKE